MLKLRITVKGRIPSKKNMRNLFVRGGKLFNIPSKNYKKWHDEASKELPSMPPFNKVSNIELRFFAPDKRSADLTNKAESILDLLVDNNILEDDNWFLLEKVVLYFMGVDRENPRCEISIFQED